MTAEELLERLDNEDYCTKLKEDGACARAYFPHISDKVCDCAGQRCDDAAEVIRELLEEQAVYCGTKAVERQTQMDSYEVGAKKVKREYLPGNHVIFVDPYGQERDAIVTEWHCTHDRDGHVEAQKVNQESWAKQGVKVELSETCCNLVWISSDVKRRDSHGQQLVRESSVVHKGSQPAHGNYWKWPDE